MLITTEREKAGSAIVFQDNDDVVLRLKDSEGVEQEKKFSKNDPLDIFLTALREMLTDNTFQIQMNREPQAKASKRLWKTQLRIKDGKVILTDDTIPFKENDPEKAAQVVVQEKYTLAIFLWLLRGLTNQKNIDSIELVIED